VVLLIIAEISMVIGVCQMAIVSGFSLTVASLMIGLNKTLLVLLDD